MLKKTDCLTIFVKQIAKMPLSSFKTPKNQKNNIFKDHTFNTKT